MRVADIFGWAAVVLIAAPMLAGVWYLTSVLMQGAPWPFAACVISIELGAICFAIAAVLD